MAAFRKSQGAWVWDSNWMYRLTKDDVLVVHHDYDLKRTCGTGKYIRRSYLMNSYAGTGLMGTEERIPEICGCFERN